MKALLIDPVTRTISEVEYNGNYKQIYDLIDADTFDIARLYPNGDGAFVDDEGLLKPCDHFWLHENYPSPLAGKGLLLGCDDEGESIAPSTDIESLRNAVRFMSRNDVLDWLDARGETI